MTPLTEEEINLARALGRRDLQSIKEHSNLPTKHTAIEPKKERKPTARQLEKQRQLEQRKAMLDNIVKAHGITVWKTPMPEAQDIPIVPYQPLTPRTPQESPRYQ